MADQRRPARGAEGVGCGEGCPLPIIFFYFGSQYGEFWCILNGIFTVQLPDKHVGISLDNILHSSCRRRAHLR